MAYLECSSSSETSLTFTLYDITPGKDYGHSRTFYFTCNSETKSKTVSSTSTSTSVSCSFSGLSPGTGYQCDCEFTNSYGTTYSWDAYGETDEPTPVNPPVFNYVTTQTSITMRWDNARGTGLYAIFELYHDGDWETWEVDTAAEEIKWVFRDLSPGTRYQYRSSIYGTSYSSSGYITTDQETRYDVYVTVKLNGTNYSSGSFSYRGSASYTISDAASRAGASLPSGPSMAVLWTSAVGYPHAGTQLSDTISYSGNDGDLLIEFTSDPGSYLTYILENESYNEYEIHIFNGSDFNDMYKPYIFNGTSWSDA